MHAEMHKQEVKPCRFFKNHEICPFEDVGCKFMHEETEKPDENNLCVKDDVKVGDEDHMGDNDCHLCDKMFSCTETLVTHLQVDHSDYHQKMVDAAKRRILETQKGS